MHSFLISTPPDIKINSDVLEIHPDKSIGIEEVRSIQAFLSRKPIQSTSNTVIIHEAHLLSIPAQHAILKTLEEPPSNSQIYLVTRFPDQLLPTILSRVQSLSADYKSNKSYTTYSEKSLELFSQLLSSSIGDRLALLEKVKFTRESALSFFSDLEIILHDCINHKLPSPLTSRGELEKGFENRLYEDISLSKRYLKANVNLKLILDHFALNLRQV